MSTGGQMEPFVSQTRATSARLGVGMLTPDRMREVMGAFLRSKWAPQEALDEAGLKKLTDEELFALDGRDVATRKVRWEVRYTHFTLPERGVVGVVDEHKFVRGTLTAIWDAKMELLTAGQPQAQWAMVCATVTDQVVKRNEAAPKASGYKAGDVMGAVAAIQAGQGREVEVDASREVIPVVDQNIVVRAVFVDLTRGDLRDPNQGFDGAIAGGAMQTYVDQGRPYRLMPMGMRRERENARATLREYLGMLEERRNADLASVRAAVAVIDPVAVTAMRQAGLSDAAIATNLRIPLEHLVENFPKR